jgi:hypothetical protein
MLVIVGSADLGPGDRTLAAYLVLLGSGLTGIGVVLATPVVVSWCALLLVRRRTVAATLAGRTIQADGAGASRIVAGLGIAVFLACGGLGVLGAFEHTNQFIIAMRDFGPGPQEIQLSTPNLEQTFDPGVLESVREVPGVLGIVPHRLQANCNDEGTTCIQVRIGTCADLELSFAVTGCDDTRASIIVPDWTGLPEVARVIGNESLRPAPGATITLDRYDPTTAERHPTQDVTLDGPPLTLHVKDQRERWVWDMYDVAFIPQGLVGDWWSPMFDVTVLAQAGPATFHEVFGWAAVHGMSAFQPSQRDWATLTQVRAAVLTLAGVAIGVALLILALSAVDRARERRRPVARQLMVGVPGTVLRAGQFIQVLLPAFVAVGLGMGAGAVGVRGYANLADQTSLVAPQSWLSLAATALLGSLVAALVVLPNARPRLTADLLRRE